MTDNEIIKVKDLLHRENCIGLECSGCPIYDTVECVNVAHTNLLRKYVCELQAENDHQRAEIERLNKKVEEMEERQIFAEANDYC